MNSRTVATKPLTQWLIAWGSWGALYGFCLLWYIVLLDSGELIKSFLFSIRLALLVTVLSVTLGTTAAMGLTRYHFPGRDLLNTLLMSPLIFPSIITGIALLQFFSMLGISSAFFTLTVGHTIITLPYVVRNVIASLQSTRGNFEEAARVLGASAWQAFTEHTLMLENDVEPGDVVAGKESA